MSKTVKPSWSFPKQKNPVLAGFLFETKYKKRQKDITYAII